MNSISVIIRNRNEQDYIGFAIQSVVDHLTDYEIIVINNESIDDSSSIVKLFNFESIGVETITDYTPGKSINHGVSVASGEFVLMLSAHSQIIQFNQNEILKYFNDYVCVFGNQIPIFRGKKISKRYVWSNFIDDDVVNMWSDAENRYFLHNAFAIYPRQILLDHPFDESLSGKEDRYWVNDMVEAGHKFLYKSDMICNHYWTSGGATWKGIG
jgi:glycosyltransferase involved in cell wall biosynthesis